MVKYDRKEEKTSRTENYSQEKCIYIYKGSLYKALYRKIITICKISKDLMLDQYLVPYMCNTQKTLSNYFE